MKKGFLFVIVGIAAAALSLLWNGSGFVIVLVLTWGTVLWNLIAPRMIRDSQSGLEQKISLGLIWCCTTAGVGLFTFVLISWMHEAGIAVSFALLAATVVVCPGRAG